MVAGGVETVGVATAEVKAEGPRAGDEMDRLVAVAMDSKCRIARTWLS